MKTETTIQGLSASLNPARTARKSIGFVPTMGNLHQGHLNLVREAKKLCDVVVVSIFVNPIQFGPNEDFDSYPRTLEQDQRLLAEVGCDIVFAPSVEQMYGNSPRLTNITVSDITNDLCGLQRPGHFDGVAVVVTKLFNIVQPDFAFFGQKDYQQLAVIRQLVQDLNMPLEVIGVPIVRAEDGLALSSRNRYLSEAERAEALQLPLALRTLARDALAAAHALPTHLPALEAEAMQALAARGWTPDYLTVRRRADLLPPQAGDGEGALVVLGAAKLGGTRLIDNLEI